MAEEGAAPLRAAWRRNELARGAISLAAGLTVIALAGAIWRFHFETNDDLTFAFAMTGNALLPPQGDFYLFFRGGLGELLSLLHGWFGPSTYGAFVLGLLTLAIARFFARVLTAPERRDPIDLAATFAVTAYVVAVTFSPLNFSRIALLATFVGFDGLQSRWTRGERGGAWVDVLLVLVGYAVRPQAGVLALVLSLSLGCFESLRPWVVARSVLTAAAIVLAFWVYDRIATSGAEQEYVRRYWYATALLDRKAYTSLPDDPIDLARLNLARRWLFFDDRAYDSEFLAQHVQVDSFTWQASLAEAPQRALSLAQRIGASGGLWLPSLLLWLTAERLVAGDWRRAGEPLAKTLVVYGILLAVDAIAGMKPRVREPAVAILCLNLLGARMRWRTPPGQHWFSYAALFAAASAIVVDGIRLAPQRQVFDTNVRRVHAQVNAMERLGDKTLLTTLGDPFETMLVWNSPLDVRLPSPTLRILPLQGWVTQSEGYRAAMDALGGGRGFGGLVHAIERDPAAFALIGNRSDTERTLRWAAAAYGPRLRIEARTEGRLPYYAFVER